MNENNIKVDFSKVTLSFPKKNALKKLVNITTSNPREAMISLLDTENTNSENIQNTTFGASSIVDSAFIQSEVSCTLTESHVAKLKKPKTHFKSISKQSMNFLFQYQEEDVPKTPRSENSQLTISLKTDDKKKQTNVSVLSDFSCSVDDEKQLKSPLTPLSSRKNLNFRKYDENPNLIVKIEKTYSTLIEFFTKLTQGINEISSFEIIYEWFEQTRGEEFYSVEVDSVYKESLSRIIVKEFFMLELIAINLHLFVLNKVIEFPDGFIQAFYSQMKLLFEKLYENFCILCHIGLSNTVFTLVFMNKKDSQATKRDFASVNNINKDIRNNIGKVTKIMKKSFDMNDSETFCYKHLKSVFKNFYNEFYQDFKEYSYNVYLYNGIFLSSNDSLFEESYCISNAMENSKDETLTVSSTSLVSYPYLPEISPNFTYTLVVDLDETLLHCIKVISYIYLLMFNSRAQEQIM
jgi:hypothetical protein